MARKIRIIDDKRLKVAIDAVKEIPTDGTFEVIIKEFTRKRTTAQNSLLHIWRKDISDVTGESIKECRLRLAKDHMIPILIASEEEKDEEVKETINNLRQAYKLGAKEESKFIYEQYVDLLSSRSLSIDQFTQFLNEIERECVDQGIPLRHPDDYHFALGRSE